MTWAKFFSGILLAAFAGAAGAADTRLSTTELQLAAFDCKSGDRAACEALVVLYPRYEQTLLTPAEVEDVRTAAMAGARQACETGDTAACTDYATMLGADGRGQDQPEVYALYAASCDAGDGLACGLLSDLEFSLRTGIGPSYTAFYADQASACAAGDETACVSQARLNVLAPMVPRDRAIWFDQLRRLCDEADIARACAVLAYIQTDEGLADYAAFDPGLPEEFKSKRRYALWDGTKACDLGHPVGCYVAALAYSEGQAVARNSKIEQRYLVRACRGGFRRGCDEINRATNWRPTDNLLGMKKACEEGDFSACHYYAANVFAPLMVNPSTVADIARMAEFRNELQRICADGWVRGCADLATLARGSGELRKAERYGSTACLLSEGMGCVVMGNVLKLDRRTPEAERMAVSYHRRGCELRTWVACNNLGDSYENGTGIAADAAQAAQHYRMACDNDLALGCRNLAKLNEVHAPDQAGAYWARACELDARYCRKE